MMNSDDSFLDKRSILRREMRIPDTIGAANGSPSARSTWSTEENSMIKEFTVSTIIRAPAKKIYDAWLNSEGHARMTGGSATVSDVVGAEFEAWDGYIHGKNLVLESGKRIVQSWRTTEFSGEEEDSQIEVMFEKAERGTKVTIHHTKLPPHGKQYKQGWIDNYFEPMKKYFKD
jgi:activator of HSP90 ATPase